jgi:hypothetical protein
MAGAGYKLYATGDVLTASDVNTYLMQQTVMVFNNAAARTTALSGVVSEGMLSYLKDTNAVEVYDGANWVASDDPNAIQNTIVDAKGDLITATGADVPARLAVGSNGDTLVADSAATTGLRWSSTPSASNPILNSNFSIAQRGTSFAAPAGNSYTLDRWNISNTGTTRTWSRQTASLDGFQFCMRVQRDSGSIATALMGLSQSLETVNAIPYQGKTITISAYVRKGADFSAASSVAKLFAASGTGTDQKFIVNGAGYTGESIFINENITLTTSWQRFSATATVSTAATELAFGVSFTPSGTAGAADYLEFTGYQVDVGSVALPYRTYASTIQGELAACQRYFYRWNGDVGDAFCYVPAHCQAYSTTQATGILQMPQTMRTKPSFTAGTIASFAVTKSDNTVTATTAIAGDTFNPDSVALTLTAGASTFTAGNSTKFLRNSSATSTTLDFSAEL